MQKITKAEPASSHSNRRRKRSVRCSSGIDVRIVITPKLVEADHFHAVQK